MKNNKNYVEPIIELMSLDPESEHMVATSDPQYDNKTNQHIGFGGPTDEIYE